VSGGSGRRAEANAHHRPKAASRRCDGRDLDAFELRHAKADLRVSTFDLKGRGAQPSYPDMAGRTPRIGLRVRRVQDQDIDGGSAVRELQGDPQDVPSRSRAEMSLINSFRDPSPIRGLGGLECCDLGVVAARAEGGEQQNRSESAGGSLGCSHTEA